MLNLTAGWGVGAFVILFVAFFCITLLGKGCGFFAIIVFLVLGGCIALAFYTGAWLPGVVMLAGVVVGLLIK